MVLLWNGQTTFLMHVNTFLRLKINIDLFNMLISQEV